MCKDLGVGAVGQVATTVGRSALCAEGKGQGEGFGKVTLGPSGGWLE